MTLAQLIACGVHPTQARQWLAPLAAAMAEFDIATPRRQAAFVAQLMQESARLTTLEEDLRWRTPERLDATFTAVRGRDDAAALIKAGPRAIANRIYANRNGNGDEASGDGWRYRGRGPIQLTGRRNYAAAGKELGLPLVDKPDLVLDPSVGARVAGWFWKTSGCNPLADADDVDGITVRVNGPAKLHAAERREGTRLALAALGGATAQA